MKRTAFTLLELIVVIIIIGVLTSLALPRLFSTIERSRSAEAIMALTAWRNAIERCVLWNGGKYLLCIRGTFDDLDIDDPFDAPGSHFDGDHGLSGRCGNQETTDGYFIFATRNDRDLGIPDTGPHIMDKCACQVNVNSGKSAVALCYDIVNNHMDIKGTGFYEGI